MEEIEIKFLDIDQVKLEKTLLSHGAKKLGEYHFRRIVFDYPDFRLDKHASWLRLRDEGDKITLTYKKRLGDKVDGHGGDEGMLEHETIVADFDTTRNILLAVGFIEKMYQENKRIKYLLNGVECDIDEWPLLSPYLEIEGNSWDEVYTIAEKLGFKRDDAKIFSTNQIYRSRGLDDRNFVKLTFDEQIERQENRF